MKTRLLFVSCILLFQISPFAQSLTSAVTLHGKVTDAAVKSPLAGVSLKLTRSGITVTSADNGVFSILLRQDFDTLLISFTGYENIRVPVSAERLEPLLIQLSPFVNALKEVTVSTGYQELPKERATGSFARIDQAVLNKQVGPNILDRLNGVTPGVLFPLKPDGPALMVRGLSTINGPKTPLIVLDNFPYEGDVNNINPNDVLSVTILKDAAAASIWGTRAGNGVIVITTKRGRAGQPVRVSISSNITVTQKPDLWYLPQISSADFVDVESFLFGRGFYDSWLNSPQQAALSPAVEILAKKTNGQLSPSAADVALNLLRQHDSRNDYSKYFYRNALKQQYAVSMSGGGPNMGWYLSAGFDKNLNELDAPYNRLNLNLQNNWQPLKKLQLSAGILYTHSKSSSGRPGINQVTAGQWRVPYLSFADDAGKPLAVGKQWRQPYTDTAGGGGLLDWNYYPLTDYLHNRTSGVTEDLLANLGLQYKFFPGLSLELKYQYEKQQVDGSLLQDADSYAARNLVNNFSQLDAATGNITYIVPKGGILSTNTNSIESHNIRGQLDYNKTWKQHSVTVIGGAEIRQVHTTGNNFTVYGYNPDVLTTADVDFVKFYPTFISGEGQRIPSNLSFTDQLNRFVSVYANGAYTLNNKYTVSASARRDASNLFGVSTNHKWNPLWSAGTAWNISNEKFYHAAFLPYLKLRATYGFSGNVDQNRSAVTTLYFYGNEYSSLPAARVDQFANPDIRWEKVTSFNTGIDFNTKGNVISGSIEYYRKKGTDLFGPSPVDYTSGINTGDIIGNVAAIKGYGWDISLQAKVLDRKLKWTTSLLFNYQQTITTKFYRSSPLAATYIKDGNYVSGIEGQPAYALVSYRFGGLDSLGNPKGFLKGKPSTDYYGITSALTGMDGLVAGGSGLPVYFGSVGNTFQYRGVSLTFNITYKLGYWYRKETINYYSLFNNGISHSDYNKRWQQPGDELKTTVPSMIYPLAGGRDDFYAASQVNVRRADQVRLQFINMAYDFPRGKSKTTFQQLQLYFNASDLGILWRANKDGIDPDYPTTLPPGKSYTLGVRAIL